MYCAELRKFADIRDSLTHDLAIIDSVDSESLRAAVLAYHEGLAQAAAELGEQLDGMAALDLGEGADLTALFEEEAAWEEAWHRAGRETVEELDVDSPTFIVDARDTLVPEESPPPASVSLQRRARESHDAEALLEALNQNPDCAASGLYSPPAGE
jgi:hypothetical protein